MNKFILIDTGFWFALFNKKDGLHDKAIVLADLISGNNLLIPWPTLYETINTNFSKNLAAINGLGAFIKNPKSILIDDLKYRQDNLSDVFGNSRSLSLVDRIIRSILSDQSYKIDYLITFNTGDFVDLCNYRRIEILNGE
jgi:predicted nucleic acid-binding protein